MLSKIHKTHTTQHHRSIFALLYVKCLWFKHIGPLILSDSYILIIFEILIIVISYCNVFIFNKLHFWDLNPDFNHFIYHFSSCQLNSQTSLLVPKAWVHVDRTLGLSNSSWIDIGSCLRRQIPHYHDLIGYAMLGEILTSQCEISWPNLKMYTK